MMLETPDCTEEEEKHKHNKKFIYSDLFDWPEQKHKDNDLFMSLFNERVSDL